MTWEFFGNLISKSIKLFIKKSTQNNEILLISIIKIQLALYCDVH